MARPLIVFGALLHTEADASAREQVWSSLRQALRVTVIDQDSLHVLDFLGVEGSIVTDPLILVSQHCQPDVLARRHRFLSLAGFVPTGPEPIVVDLRTIGPSEASSWLEGCPGPARRRLVVIDDALGQGAASGHASGSQRRSVEGVTYAPALLGIDDVLAIIGGASLVVTDDRDLAVVAEAFDVETRATAPCKAGISGPPIDLVDVRRRHGPAMEAAASARLERQRQAGSDIDALVLDLDVGWALAAPASGAAVRSIDDLEYELEALRAQAAESTRREATMRVALADRFLELVRDLELARTELAGAMTDVAKLESMLHLQSVAARREIRARLASTDRDSR